ncbi:cytochrome P450 [Schizophyllum fasciatum]
MASIPVYYVVLLIVVVYLLYRRHYSTNTKRPPLPPGPPASSVAGFPGSISQDASETAYMKWSRRCESDIICFNILGKHIVVLNSKEAATDLLEKRGTLYSDRPPFTYFEAMGFHDNLAFSSSQAPTFPASRRIFHSYFSKSACRAFFEIQESEAQKLARGIIAQPDNWRVLVRLFSTAVITRIMTGEEVEGVEDESVKNAERLNNALSGGPALGTAGLDRFPWLSSLPSWCDPTGSTAYARKWRHVVEDLQAAPYRRVKEDISAGVAKSSFVLDRLQEEDARARSGEGRVLTDWHIQGLIGTAFGAAQETTADSIVVFVLAMTMNPQIQRKAKKELDTVVGQDRLPTLADREDLPYIECIVQETFRIWPTLPLGVPHKASEDDIYKGMFIPKGSSIMVNATAITHDDRVYTHPWTFDPDRYLSKDQEGRGEPQPSSHFGYGRRICPGRFMGENSVFIAIATMLHVLWFAKARGVDGEEITVDFATARYARGFTSHPVDVPCNISAASKAAVELVLASGDHA